MNDGNNIEMTDWMPAVPLRGMTILPGVMAHIDLNRKKSITALERATKGMAIFFRESFYHEWALNFVKSFFCIY